MAVKNRSHLHNENMTPEQHLSHFFLNMDANLEELVHRLRLDQIDLDEYGYDQGSTGIVDLTRRYRNNYVITDIIATWGTGATSVALTIKDRIIVVPPALGIISLTGMHGINLDQMDIVKFQVLPALPCYFGFQGYGSEKLVDRK
jgi:hypothetical protein